MSLCIRSISSRSQSNCLFTVTQHTTNEQFPVFTDNDRNNGNGNKSYHGTVIIVTAVMITDFEQNLLSHFRIISDVLKLRTR